ncbi:hypothetical protein BEL04_08075 [Mucilaginibacter sp. PPCGB 2223]|uniref:hypothetical protein n=1 Tax=Mucilaginibacter sp. PPCGB 2223 TaxID=1886027 RepID=UPI0008267BBE|nr:hypothetical protein [Mucilaginibacter sp. PPCGB 2223]OCX54208.1 hypothetical protein BEL04_08075 [Mucilaginibacter sp. PPCGB 2223]
MKALKFLIVLLLAVLFYSCKSHTESTDFSGTYVLQTKGEYAIDYDTLILSSNKSNTYSIQNNSGFQKIRNGVIMPKEYKKTSWLATWNEDKQLLSETDFGRQILFKDNGKSLVLKNSTYKKIR